MASKCVKNEGNASLEDGSVCFSSRSGDIQASKEQWKSIYSSNRNGRRISSASLFKQTRITQFEKFYKSY